MTRFHIQYNNHMNNTSHYCYIASDNIEYIKLTGLKRTVIVMTCTKEQMAFIYLLCKHITRSLITVYTDIERETHTHTQHTHTHTHNTHTHTHTHTQTHTNTHKHIYFLPRFASAAARSFCICILDFSADKEPTDLCARRWK